MRNLFKVKVTLTVEKEIVVVAKNAQAAAKWCKASKEWQTDSSIIGVVDPGGATKVAVHAPVLINTPEECPYAGDLIPWGRNETGYNIADFFQGGKPHDPLPKLLAMMRAETIRERAEMDREDAELEAILQARKGKRKT